jgi:hypothetical protein
MDFADRKSGDMGYFVQFLHNKKLLFGQIGVRIFYSLISFWRRRGFLDSDTLCIVTGGEWLLSGESTGTSFFLRRRAGVSKRMSDKKRRKKL